MKKIRTAIIGICNLHPAHKESVKFPLISENNDNFDGRISKR